MSGTDSPVQRTPEEEEEEVLAQRRQERRIQIGIRAQRLRDIRRAAQEATRETIEPVVEPVRETNPPLRLPEYEQPSTQDFERIAPTLIVILEINPLTKAILTKTGIRTIDERLQDYTPPLHGRPYRYFILRKHLDRQIPVESVGEEIQASANIPKHAMVRVIESLDPSDWVKAARTLQNKGVKKMKRFLDSIPPEDPAREMLKQKMGAMLKATNEYFLQMKELKFFAWYVRLHVYARYFGFNPNEEKFMEVKKALVEKSDTLRPALRGQVLQSIRMMQFKIDPDEEVIEKPKKRRKVVEIDPAEEVIETPVEKSRVSSDLAKETLETWGKELCLLYHIKVLLSESPAREAIEKLYLENTPLLDRFVRLLEVSNMLMRYLKLLQETGILETSTVIRNYWLTWFQQKASNPSVLSGDAVSIILRGRRMSPLLMDSLYVASHALGIVDELVEKERAENHSRQICVEHNQQSGIADRNFAQEVLRSAPRLASRLMNLINSYSRHVHRRTDGRIKGR